MPANSCMWCDDVPGVPCICKDVGEEVRLAIERGKRLHPWTDQQTAHDALRDEMRELDEEMLEDDPNPHRIYAEALDVFVCAWRVLNRE